MLSHILLLNTLLMKKLLLLFCLIWLAAPQLKATNDESDSLSKENLEILEALKVLDSAQKLKYQTGTVTIGSGLATINVPKGFKYLDSEQTEFVLHKLWNNPPNGGYLGMLLLENADLLDSASWVFTIQYDAIGYVSDKDANDVNYDDLLADLKKESEEDNIGRKEMGYPVMHLVGWASSPYYDENKKILHWAKEFSVDENATNTLNYNVRILGRKGVLILNAIAAVPQLEDVKKYIDPLTGAVEFSSGNKYSDFNPDVDEVAAWTIGGLVAGKVLAKAGLFAGLAKFGKVIILGLIALGAGVIKFFRGRKNKETATDSNTTA